MSIAVTSIRSVTLLPNIVRVSFQVVPTSNPSPSMMSTASMDVMFCGEPGRSVMTLHTRSGGAAMFLCAVTSFTMTSLSWRSVNRR